MFRAWLKIILLFTSGLSIASSRLYTPNKETFLDDVIRVEDRYYILATSSLADDRTRVLKHGETFAVFDRYGDIQAPARGELGLYHEGTRFLSLFVLRVGRDRPLLLSSTVKDDNALLTVDLTNPRLYQQWTGNRPMRYSAHLP